MSTNDVWPRQGNSSSEYLLFRVSLCFAQRLAMAIALGMMAPLFPVIALMHVWVWLHEWLLAAKDGVRGEIRATQ